jgi:uncharacterized protein YjlB
MPQIDKRVNTNPVIKDYSFELNKNFPNSALPLLIYKNAFFFGKQKNKSAEILQKVFNKNNWKNSWSNGIYTFHHYHSNTHECMGIASGKAWVIFGGTGGRRMLLEKGDIIIIPAGLGHKCSSASTGFLCVGAYPGGSEYDINLGTKKEFEKATSRLSKISKPALDPVFGKEGFLKTFWKL